MNRYKLTKREQQVTNEYGSMYHEMYFKIRESLESKTVDELKEISECFSKLSTTNCGWTSYAVRDIVLPWLRRILKEKEEQIAVREVSEDGSSKDK